MISAAYIHIPFCSHICYYCDYNKIFFNEQIVDDYLVALEQEIKMTTKKIPTDYLRTIFVGGGTPTSLNTHQLAKLTSIIKKYLNYDAATEFTFEANPDCAEIEKYKILQDAGVNRLSFGVQTFNDKLLKEIGRTHHKNDVFKIIENVTSLGFSNLNIDLMFGLPHQTVADFSNSLEIAKTLPIKHLSAYSLIVEPKTVFYNLAQKNKLHLPIEDDEALMYDLLVNEMQSINFKQYEISNFAKKNYESRQNLTYWNNEQYYGFGAGAHGYVGQKRYGNVLPVNKYINMLKEKELPRLETVKLTKQQQIEEEMFLGLRKTAGISIDVFKKKFSIDPLKYYEREIDSNIKKDFITVDGDTIKLTKLGLIFSNEVFQTFIK